MRRPRRETGIACTRRRRPHDVIASDRSTGKISRGKKKKKGKQKMTVLILWSFVFHASATGGGTHGAVLRYHRPYRPSRRINRARYVAKPARACVWPRRTFFRQFFAFCFARFSLTVSKKNTRAYLGFAVTVIVRPTICVTAVRVGLALNREKRARHVRPTTCAVPTACILCSTLGFWRNDDAASRKVVNRVLFVYCRYTPELGLVCSENRKRSM